MGDVISYSYEVSNTGNVTISGISISDDKATVSCDLTVLAPGESMTCTASYTIDQADLDEGSVTNVASASGTDTNGDPITPPTDSETVTANQDPKLTIDKTADPTSYDSVGDVISYSYEVSNTGNVTISGPITITDDKVTATCPSGDLAPGDPALTCTASYTITQADLDAGSVTNSATATGKDTNGNDVTSEPDSETVTADQNPAIDVEKLVSVDGGTTFVDADDPLGPFVAEGSEVQIKFVVTNTENVTLSSINLEDSDFDLTDCAITDPLAPNVSSECEITVSAMPVLDERQHTDTATVEVYYYGPDNPPVSDSDNANYYVMQTSQPSIQINSLTAELNGDRTQMSGKFNATDESESANWPDGFFIGVNYLDVDWDFKLSRKDAYEESYINGPQGGWLYIDGAKVNYTCEYEIIDIDGDTSAARPLAPGETFVIDESVNIGYTCDFFTIDPDDTSITYPYSIPVRGGYLRGTSRAEIFNRDQIFMFSNDWLLDPKKGI